MKKRIVGIFLLLFITGCSSNEKNSSSESTTTKDDFISSTTKESSQPVESWLSVNGSEAKYTDQNTIELTGTAQPNTDITVSLEKDKNEITKVTSDDKGNFKVSFTSPENEDSYLFQNKEERLFITLYSETNFAKREDIRKQKEEKNIEEEKRNTEKKEKKTEIVENDDKESDVDDKLLDYQKEGNQNATDYPADSASILFDNDKNKFKGMNYFFEGEIIGEVKLKNVTDGKAWLVKNTNGYVMPIEYSYFNASEGDQVKVWGTLSGLKFSNSDLKVDNVVGATGSMHAMSVEVNGETQY